MDNDINNFNEKSRILLDYQTNIFHLLDGYLNKEFGGYHIKNWEKITKLNLNTSHKLIFINKFYALFFSSRYFSKMAINSFCMFWKS